MTYRQLAPLIYYNQHTSSITIHFSKVLTTQRVRATQADDHNRPFRQ